MKTKLSGLLLLACAALGGFTTPASGAEGGRSTFNYMVGFPMGDTKNFIGKPSFLGVDLDMTMTKPTKDSEVSLVLGWQRFKEELTNATYTADTLTVTADQSRSLTHLPFVIKYRHYPGGSATTKWFVGGGAGATYVERLLYVGSFNFSQYGWQFLLRPEAGLIYSFSKTMEIETSLRYDYGFKTGGLPALSILSLGVGISVSY